MKLPRDLSGRELAVTLCKRWDYTDLGQEGSHIILQTHVPFPHRLSIPNHSTLRIGTLNSILRAVAKHKRLDKDAILASM
jgi:predicted RNA binding protein YcfA (HicA-like mRNA interferase family)